MLQGRPMAHQLKWKLRSKGITLYQLRTMLGGSPSEGRLSRVLNGIESMPTQLERQIRGIVEAI